MVFALNYGIGLVFQGKSTNTKDHHLTEEISTWPRILDHIKEYFSFVA